MKEQGDVVGLGKFSVCHLCHSHRIGKNERKMARALLGVCLEPNHRDFEFGGDLDSG